MWPRPLRGLGDAAIRELEEVVAPDEERAQTRGPIWLIGASVGPPHPLDIGRSTDLPRRGSFRGAPPSGTLAPCVLD